MTGQSSEQPQSEPPAETPLPDEALVLALDSPAATLDRVGGKGASLARLAAAGLPVPPGFHLTTSAYHRFVHENRLADAVLAAASHANADVPATLDRAAEQIQSLFMHGAMPPDVAARIRAAYDGLGAGNLPVAVRSSATAEDLPEMSFAGQQETYLNVRGGGAVLESVKRCWASLWTARALGYRARQGVRSKDVALAVVVQELVPADAAGVLFTANPVTGERGQVMINAAWGLGEAIVSGSVTPDTFIVNKQTGEVASQKIADKAVMTVRAPEGTRAEPVPPGKRSEPALTPAQAAELARLGAQIEQLYGQPMDIEWAMAGARLSILQARPITALPEPRPALNWDLPNPSGRYGRTSVIELLPDPLSPLFATLALPLWNDAGRDFVRRVRLPSELMGQGLITINEYVYQDYSTFKSPLAGLVLTFRLAWSLLFRGAYRLISMAGVRWADEARPQYAKAVAAWATQDVGTMTSSQLLDGARQITEAAAAHYLTVQAGTLATAYMSETLFTIAYNHLIRRKGDPPALTFLLGFDSAPIVAEKSLYDLATWARTRPELAGYLARATGQEIAATFRCEPAPIADAEGWRGFSLRLAEHQSRFGHAICDLDFAKPLPAEDPASLLGALQYFLTGKAQNPHERQSAAAAARETATESLLAQRKGLRRRLFRWLVRWAQRYAPLREDALADVGLGWPVVRRMFGEVGRRLATAGVLTASEDVFWLEWDELRAAATALDTDACPPDFRPNVAERRARWERERRVTPPSVLPVKDGARFMGIDCSRWMPARTDQAVGDTIKGIGTSPGRVAGFARVIHGSDEFVLIKPGDILVAKITTPAWTPLFALASGVVTDVGGPLSHSSIVAREYHIPAVLGTGVATERIATGQRIVVDGDRGTVLLGKAAGQISQPPACDG